MPVFSPEADNEYLRVLKKGGIMLRVIPLEKHLFELKAAIYDTPYKNEPQDFSYLISSLFGQNYALLASESSKYYLGNYAVFIFLAVFFMFDFGRRIHNRLSHSKKLYGSIFVSLYNALMLLVCIAFML